VGACSGCVTHPDARIALTRALTEAAQSRLSGIQGGREDLPDHVPAGGAPPAERKHESGPEISFDEIASHQHPSVNEDVEFIIDRMRQSGFEQAVVVDITRPEVGIPAVRVIVPRSEAWTLYFADGGRASLGPRALQQMR
jgi:ribosomal protein S12 methylthiotransferase accessory factor